MNDPGNSKVTLGSKNQKKFHGGCMPPDLEAYAFDVCLGKRSLFFFFSLVLGGRTGIFS